MFAAVGHWRTKSETVKQERRRQRVCVSVSQSVSQLLALPLKVHIWKNTASHLQAPGEEQPEKLKNRGDGGKKIKLSRRCVVGPSET